MIGLKLYPRQPINADSIKIVTEGNSITFGVGASSTANTWPNLMKTFEPLVGKNITVYNHAVGGKAITNVGGNTNNFAQSRAGLINALSSTAHNIVFLNEFINELRLNGINASAAFEAFVNSCLDLRIKAASANKKLSLSVCTTTPAGAAPAGEGQSWINARMAAIIQCNQWLETYWGDFSDHLTNVAKFNPYRSMYQQDDWTPAAFNAAGVFQRSDGEPNDLTHQGDAGNLIMGQIGALTVSRVRYK